MLTYIILFASATTIVVHSIPDVDACCRRRTVSDLCARTLCNPQRPPNDFEVYDIFDDARYSCSRHLPAIAHCLADGRDHTACCTHNAKDIDESACFGICRGVAAVLNTSHWEAAKLYQTCLSVNVASIYGCFRHGYKHNPSAPMRVRVDSVGTDTADVSWTAPTQLAHEAHAYAVSWTEFGDNDDDESEAHVVETRHTRITIGSLRADTQYAIRVVALSRDGARRSLPSDVIYAITKGVAPQVIAYRDSLAAPIGVESTATIACRVQALGNKAQEKRQRVDWTKRDETGKFVPIVDSNKYGLAAYVARHPRDYISTLQIRSLDAADYGLYRCTSANEFGVGSADIRLLLPTAVVVPAAPPNTTACCERLHVKERCLVACGPDAPDRKRGVRPEMLLAGHSCFGDFAKMQHCALEGVDQGACCLRRKVPAHCLPMCDGESTPLAQPLAAGCIPHTFDIFACLIEQAHVRPASVQRVHLWRRSADAAVIRWEAAERADIYHVYFRRKSTTTGAWERTSVTGTECRLTGLGQARNADYDVVIVAANSFGRASASRTLVLSNGGDTIKSGGASHTTFERGDGPATGLLEQGVQ